MSSSVSTTVEFSIDVKDSSNASEIKSALKSHKDIVGFRLVEQSLLVTSTLPVSQLQSLLESTGNKAVVVGMGNSSRARDKTGSKEPSSAVAAMGLVSPLGPMSSMRASVLGVVRFLQMDEERCVVDGVIDGLKPGLKVNVGIHENGDLSQGCRSVGDYYTPSPRHHVTQQSPDHVGLLGQVEADVDGRAVFKIEADRNIRVPDIIGRACVISEPSFALNKMPNEESMACGIIARSAGLFENSKKFCACDGVSIWDEREKPIAGPGRRSNGDQTSMS